MPITKELRLQLYVENIKRSPNAVLQYNRNVDRLCTWLWPSLNDMRVRPSDLQDFRVSHRMLGPCCLCPMMDVNQPDFVEAAIYMATSGPNSGEYVASCARSQCKYISFIERLYDKLGVPIKSYLARESGERIPPCVIRIPENEAPRPRPRPLKRTYAMLDVTETDVQTFRPLSGRVALRASVSNTLQQLDTRLRPGIPETEFRKLFARCRCGLITTRRAFRDHVCREVIDLTVDN